jgi:hypothetical protein
MACNDPRCENGYITLGEYVAGDGSVDWHETPCSICAPTAMTECDASIPF